MFVLEQLHQDYGKQLLKWKVLLVHAGGQSQRLPSAAVLGKIFTPLPLGSPIYQMLDMKLANYLPFLPRMGSGFLHVGSDTIEVFDLGPERFVWNWDRPGFTVSAQPASLEIGAGHGVYVVDQDGVSSSNRPTVQMLNTLEVLQKPSKQLMHDRGAVHNKDTYPWVYTDSVFYFDHDVGVKLKDFYQQHKPLNCEIDSYGDFLQSLGPKATIDYTKNVKNVSTVEPNLIATREKIFELLRSTPIHTVALNVSKFYHFGTMNEYMFNLCEDKYLAGELGFLRCAFSSTPDFQPSANTPKLAKLSGSLQGCIMHSVVASCSKVHEKSVIEYCDFRSPVNVKQNTLLSNCQYEEDDEIEVPEDSFLHTVPIIFKGSSYYVTAFFSLSDDIKKKLPFKEAGSLQFYGHSLSEFADRLNISLQDIFEGSQTCSLWSAKMFPAEATMSKSFVRSLSLLQAVQDVSKEPPNIGSKLYSMQDLMKLKNIDDMLNFRRILSDSIKAGL